MSENSAARKKDVLLEHISRDIKGLHVVISDTSTVVDMVTDNERHAQALCEHMDHILTHGLREYNDGYWPAVSYFTRSNAVKTINDLSKVTTGAGRGRAWLNMALNEQAMESYVRMFIENQDILQEYYLRESFLRDIERLIVLQTLVSGMDMVSFDLPTDCYYLDYGPTASSSQLGLTRSSETTPDVQPTFISSVTPSTKRKQKETSAQGQSSDSQPVSVDETTIVREEAKPHPPTSKEETRKPFPKDSGNVASGTAMMHTPEQLTSVPNPPSSRGLASSVMVESSSTPQSSVLERMSSVPSELKDHTPLADGDDVVEHGGSHKSSRHHKKSKGKKKKRKKKADVPPAADQQTDIPSRDQQPPLSSELEVTQPHSMTEIESQFKTDDASVSDSTTTNTVIESHSQTNESPSDSLYHSKSGTVINAVPEPSLVSVTNEQLLTADNDMWSVPAEIDNRPNEQLSNFESLTPDRQRLSPHSQIADVSTSIPSDSVHLSPAQPVNRDLIAEAIEECDSFEPPAKVEHSPPGGRHDNQVKHQDSDSPQSQYADETLSVLPSNRVTSPDFEIISPTEVESRPKKSEFIWTPPPPPSEPVVYESSPHRPKKITDADKMAADVMIDDNTRLVLSLDILYTNEEEIDRLIQVATPSGVGQQRSACVLITNSAVYLVRKDGMEGLYSREFGIEYTNFDHIVIGLIWQSLIFVYHSKESHTSRKCVLLTGSEAVSRSMVESIRSAAATCPGFMRSIPLNRDDESRIAAIEKELIKQGSQTNMDIECYSLVNWEQVSGDLPPLLATEVSKEGVSTEGSLLHKSTNMIGMPVWKPAYFVLKNGRLYQYSNDVDTVARNIYEIRNSQGCVRTSAENKSFAFTVLGADGPVLTVAATNEEELTQWLQSLCEAVLKKELPGSPGPRKTCLSCALLLTQNKIHVLQEDWSNESVQLVTSCEVTDVNDVSVDSTLPLYCTITYDHDDTQCVWMVCFNSEFELGRFEKALGRTWRDIFQISLPFNEVRDSHIRRRAHKAVELLQGSRYRSDSITRGRTELTYSHY